MSFEKPTSRRDQRDAEDDRPDRFLDECDPPDLRSLHLLWDSKDPADAEVGALIESYLEKSFSLPGDILTMSDRIDIALAASVEARKGHSSDEKLRDAEYYLLGLSAASKRDVVMTGYLKTGPVYDAIKSLAHTLKDNGLPQMEMLMRNDKSEPTTRPGRGSTWAERGLQKGHDISGDLHPRILSPKERDMCKQQQRKRLP